MPLAIGVTVSRKGGKGFVGLGRHLAAPRWAKHSGDFLPSISGLPSCSVRPTGTPGRSRSLYLSSITQFETALMWACAAKHDLSLHMRSGLFFQERPSLVKNKQRDKTDSR